MLDPAKNPFWKHARRTLFLARRGDRVVGRIAAIADDEHNRVHADRTAFFGFFECENDPEAARALFAAAETAASKLLPGCDRLRGPVNPSMNDEVGFLLAAESEPGPPVLMMTYNPAYYLDLAAAAGFAKEKDLVALLAPVDDRSFARLGRITDAVRRRNPELTFRTIRMDEFPKELAKVKVVYNGAWEKNWGFVPMTSEELDAMAKKLKDLIYPPIVWFVEAGDEAGRLHARDARLQPGPDPDGRPALPVRLAEVPPREEEGRPRPPPGLRRPAGVPPEGARRGLLLRGVQGGRSPQASRRSSSPGSSRTTSTS